MILLPPTTPPTSIKALVNLFIGLINGVILLIGAYSLLTFFRGLASLIFKAGDEKALEEGKSKMKWGIIALFVMVSLWGIITLAYNTFGFQRQLGLPLLPQN